MITRPFALYSIAAILSAGLLLSALFGSLHPRRTQAGAEPRNRYGLPVVG